MSLKTAVAHNYDYNDRVYFAWWHKNYFFMRTIIVCRQLAVYTWIKSIPKVKAEFRGSVNYSKSRNATLSFNKKQILFSSTQLCKLYSSHNLFPSLFHCLSPFCGCVSTSKLQNSYLMRRSLSLWRWNVKKTNKNKSFS